MDNIKDIEKAFDIKRLELKSDKTLISLCIDTRYVLSKLIDLAREPESIEASRFLSNRVKQIQTDAEVAQYLHKWEIGV